jgi:hypothetical protein
MKFRGLLLLASFFALSLAVPAAQAEDRFGIVFQGGMLQPRDQDTNDESGTEFGLRFPVDTGTFFGFEPYIYMGDSDDTVIGSGASAVTYPGVELTSWGANISLGRLIRPKGFRVYPFAGIGNNTLHTDESESSKLGYNVGVGVGLSPGRFMVDLRAERNFVDVGDKTRDWDVYSLGLGLRIDPGF